jgi:hypothetical protein
MLLYKLMLSKTLAMDGKRSTRGKQFKQRIIVLYIYSRRKGKTKSLLLGKFKSPKY